MKKTIVLFSILVFFTQPLYGLAPRPPEWGALEDTAVLLTVAPKIDSLAKEQTPPEERAAVQAEVERGLSRIGITPLWNTLAYNNVDRSFELVIDHIGQEGRRSPYLIRFSPTTDTRYAVVQIDDEPSLNNRLARGMLGLDLSRVASAPVSEVAGEVGLPRALANRQGLMGDVPEAGRLAYLYAVTDVEPVKEVREAIAGVQRRMGKPIKAVVVLGMGGQSLGNRAVVQMLGSPDIRFIFPNNIANPDRWINELEGINPDEVLLYVSSKTGGTDETMVNFWFFWEWMIRQIGSTEVANSLVDKLKGVKNLAETRLQDVVTDEEERALLVTTLNRIAVSTTSENKGPIYRFARNNLVKEAIVPLQKPIEGRYTILFRSGQFTTALAGYDIEAMRKAVVTLADVFKENTPELNPALEAAMHAYALNRPILAGVSVNKQAAPLFEWLRQLVNESLGKEDKGPYLTFATGAEESQDLMKAPKDKLFLVINVGKERLEIPEGVSAIEINIPELDAENLARVFLFLEEFTVRYGTLLGVNPLDQPWVDKFKGILTKTATRFDTSPEARTGRNTELMKRTEVTISGGIEVPDAIRGMIDRRADLDNESIARKQLPETESGFDALLDVGDYRLQGGLEGLAREMAGQLYVSGVLGKTVNPFFIYSASPEAELLGRFIRYLGQKRQARLAGQGGGIVWDYLIGTTDQHSTAQFLGAGSNIALTTFLQFLWESELKPPLIRSDGLINERLDKKTPHEISTLYLEAVRQALNNEGRLTNTIEIPNEGKVNLVKTYLLLTRVSELYVRLVESEEPGGTTLAGLVSRNESTVIDAGKGASAGRYREESPVEAVDVNRVLIPMQVGGVGRKGFINPMKAGTTGEVSSALNRFVSRVSVLARTIIRIGSREGSALNRLFNAEEFKEKARREIYAFRLEDAIAKVEVVTEIGDLWEEIKIKAANTMIARTIQEIKRVNPKARIVVYSDDKRLNERRIKAVLDIVDSGGIYDLVVSGNHDRVLGEIERQRWVRDKIEAREKTVFASRNRLEELKTVIVPMEKFIPFPELAGVMQAILREADAEGRLPEGIIEIIVSSYKVWLELAGFSKDEITNFSDEMRESLRRGVKSIISLPIPPAPKPGSVIKLLDDEYEEATKTKGYA